MIITLDFYQNLAKHKLVAVIREASFEVAKANIQLAIENEIKLIEITLTTPSALKLIKTFSQKYPEIIIGAGTVLTHQEAVQCIQNGAQFIVSPHYVTEIAEQIKIPYLPGAFSPKEILESKAQVIKLFPANILGIEYVKSILKPYPFLKLMPSGGVNLTNAKSWLDAGCIAISVGGDLFTNTNKIQAYLKVIHGK